MLKEAASDYWLWVSLFALWTLWDIHRSLDRIADRLEEQGRWKP